MFHVFSLLLFYRIRICRLSHCKCQFWQSSINCPVWFVYTYYQMYRQHIKVGIIDACIFRKFMYILWKCSRAQRRANVLSRIKWIYVGNEPYTEQMFLLRFSFMSFCFFKYMNMALRSDHNFRMTREQCRR